MQKLEHFHLYLHNKNQIIAKKVDEIFGMKDIVIVLGDQLKKSVEFGYYSKQYKIKRTHWKAMNRPEKRCTEQNTEANTTKCITNYIEHTTGCSMGLSGSNPEIQMQEKQFLFDCSCNLIKIFSVALIKANLWNMQNLSIISIWQMTRRFTS